MPADYPPDQFHKSEHVFRPPQGQEPLHISSELLDEVQGLITETRYRSALDKLLLELEAHPDSAGAYMLAGMVLRSSRTQQLQAAEPITDAQYYDPRLDPMFTQCSSCNKTWVVLDSILTFGNVEITNPRGLQCYSCGYVLCRECYEQLEALICPHCGAQDLRERVFPTGREPRQQPRSDQPVLYAILYREGPIAPSQEEVATLLRKNSPDVLEDNAILGGLPLFPWPSEDPAELIEMVRVQIEAEYQEGVLPVGRSESIVSYFKHDGMRHVLAKLLLPEEASRALAENLQDRLQQALDESQAEVGAEAIAPILGQCGSQPLFKLTMNILHQHSSQAAEVQKPRYYVQRVGDIGLVVLAFPQLNPGVMRENLPGDYRKVPADLLQQAGIDPSEVHIAFWIAHTDGVERQIYFSLFPASPEIAPIVGVGMPSTPTLQGEVGYLFFFNWEQISAAGQPMFGRYVYQQVLPHILPGDQTRLKPALILDGEVYTQEGLSLVMYDEADQACYDRILQVGLEACFVMAIYGDWQTLEGTHQALESAKPLGYLGRVSWRKGGLEAFAEFTGQLSLVFSAQVIGRQFNKANFSYLTDQALEEMGFVVEQLKH